MPKSKSTLVAAALSVVLLLVLLSMIYERVVPSSADVALATLQEEHLALQRELASVKADRNALAAKRRETTPQTAPDGLDAPLKPRTPPSRPLAEEKPEKPSLLAMGEISVESLPGGGLKATLRFRQLTGDLGEPFVLVARVEPNAYAGIQDLQPVTGSAFKDISSRVASGGKFAVFQGTPTSGGILELALSTSAPGTVSVRVSSGLAPFELDLQPGGAAVRSLP